jgi:hypothetical protein
MHCTIYICFFRQRHVRVWYCVETIIDTIRAYSATELKILENCTRPIVLLLEFKARVS